MTPQERKVMELALEALEGMQNAIYNIGGEHVIDLNYAVEKADVAEQAITALEKALAKPKQKPMAWKLVPIEPTREMLEAMDECSIEGYDEHLYAGHAASVYMAAVDVAPTPPQPKEPEQEPVANGKLQVTLQDTPTEIELAQYKRMFAAACADLGEINEALGLDPDDGGAEPILSAIAELKAQPKEPQQEPVATLDDLEQEIYENTRQFVSRDVMEWILKRYYTTPPQRTWVGLTVEELQKILQEVSGLGWKPLLEAINAKLKEKNT